MGKFLISAGVLLVIAGLLVEFGEKFLPLGHLPGDKQKAYHHFSCLPWIFPRQAIFLCSVTVKRPCFRV